MILADLCGRCGSFSSTITGTDFAGINEQGEIAGSYSTDTSTTAKVSGDSGPFVHGFLLSANGTTFSPVDFTDGSGVTFLTNLRGGINDHANIVGVFADLNGGEQGFVTSR